MKVKELIGKLKEYNQEAEVLVVRDNMSFDFDISYGTSEGTTKKTAEQVFFDLDNGSDGIE